MNRSNRTYESTAIADISYKKVKQIRLEESLLESEYKFISLSVVRTYFSPPVIVSVIFCYQYDALLFIIIWFIVGLNNA